MLVKPKELGGVEVVDIGEGAAAWLSLQPRPSAPDSVFITDSFTLKLS